MEITRHRLDNTFELKATGRLDAFWAGHLGDEIAEVLREGARSIRLNMKEVEYVSSAGIRVLFQTYKQLKEIHGTFAVSEPSEAVRSVLQLVGVAELLFEKASSGDVQVATPSQAETFVRDNARFEILESRPSTMTARVIGSPELLVGCQFHKECCQELPFGQEMRSRPDTGVLSTLGNIIWFVLAGWWLAIGHLLLALGLAITIIGLPFAWAHLKLAGASLFPVGKEIVPRS